MKYLGKEERKIVEGSLGETIRQLRRQHSLTQTELGGEEFSKSYVSAVERDTIIPSYEAVRFFARQLEQPVEDFEQLLQQAEQKNTQVASYVASASTSEFSEQNDQEIMALLDLVLKAREHNAFAISAENVLPQEGTTSTPALQKQALYSLLRGLVAQGQGDEQGALSALEYALALAPARYRPIVLDELGVHFFTRQAYEIALEYHQRALDMLEVQNDRSSNLRLQVEVHCGRIYSLVNEPTKACKHYEQARRILRSTHNMDIAGELYLGLGYCTYATLYQKHEIYNRDADFEGMDRTFQLALAYLLQSRTLYQVGSEYKGVSIARLTQSMVLLDNSAWQQRVHEEEGSRKGRKVHPNSVTLLDEAEEQCRQVLLYWCEGQESAITADIKELLYTVLACLIDVFRQRAMIARINGYDDTALRERLLSVHLCQQTLNTFSQPEGFWPLLWQATKLATPDLTSRFQPLLSIPDPTQLAQDVKLLNIAQAEVYSMAGQLAEEQAQQKESSAEFVEECYLCAEKSFQFALNAAANNLQKNKYDSGYFSRFYQRYMNNLEKNFGNRELEKNFPTPNFLLGTLKGLLAFL